MTPIGHYLRTPRGWARVIRIDERGQAIAVYEAPLDDRGIDGAGRCELPDFPRAPLLSVPFTRAGDPPPRMA